jgi:hypothetical protein
MDFTRLVDFGFLIPFGLMMAPFAVLAFLIFATFVTPTPSGEEHE